MPQYALTFMKLLSNSFPFQKLSLSFLKVGSATGPKVIGTSVSISPFPPPSQRGASFSVLERSTLMLILIH